ncbi:MAG: ARMT1-like domain-containing protein, partial [Candidatus Thorarchaeota archaeon]
NDQIEVPLVPECSTCIILSLQTLIPLLSDDKQEQFNLYSHAFEYLSKGYDENIEPAPLSIELYQKLYTEAGVEDPYFLIKKRSRIAAEKALPNVEGKIAKFEGYNRLRACLASSIAGNVIDFNTAGHDPNLDELESIFDQILEEGFKIDDSKKLWQTLTSKQGSVLYLADNVGETNFDIPLLRLLKELGWKTVYVVKGRPMINDATEDDVRGTEIDNLSELMSSGAWAHGVPRNWVSEEFLEAAASSDIVISKGQANIETFPEIQRDLGVETYYVVKGKCPHISRAIGAKKGDNVVLRRPA